ncbi:uncharacterized protein [Palaemon carinicauda]|uniref:uncharacterized protein isoform X2 n=1 Tax=Palaemon carinicauda TaxID=392227 RepID=UPI0035B68BD3
MNHAPTSSSAFTKENINCFRLLLIVDNVYRTFMKWVFFTDAVDKEDDETLKDYLVNKLNMTHTEYREKFNRTMKNAIEKDKTCESFDVSLWLCAIKYGCRSVAVSSGGEWKQSGTFENNLSRMKNIRDSLEHNRLSVSDDTFKGKFIEMKDLLLNTIHLAELKYKKIAELMIKEKEYLDAINSIINYPLTAKEFESYKQNVILQRNKEAILSKGRKELIDHHKKISFVGALTSLLKPKKLIDVSNLFIEPDIAVLQNEAFISIEYSDMLECAVHQKAIDQFNGAQILLIKGAAGCGKSTLMKMILSEWGSMNNSIGGLDHYEVLLFVDCRNIQVSCLSKLVRLQMAKASMGISEKEALYCVLSLPTLIIFDGLDEMNNNAENLLQESLNILTNDNMTIIATIRTERYEEFSFRIPDDMQKVIFSMNGVTESSREDLVKNLHEELKDQGMGGKDVEKLLQYLRTREANRMAFLNIPFNLVLMTYLWADSSESVRSITTAVELNCRINEQIKKRIHERLVPCDGSSLTLDDRIDIFINGLCWEALKAIRENAMKLSTEALDHLNCLSKSLSLHLDDMLGSFLQLDPSGDFIFFHNAQKEFLASWYIFKTVTRNDVLDETENVKSEIMDNFRSGGISANICQEIQTHISYYLQDYHKDGIEDILKHVNEDNIEYRLSKYQNILINILGLFHQQKSSVSEALYIELLDLLKRSGVKDKESWITILNNVKCEEKVIKQICSRPEMKGGVASISKGNLLAYNALIKYITVDSIRVNIPVNPTELVPPFDQLIERVVARKAPVHSLVLRHLFHHPKTTLLDTSLEAKITQLVRVL